jgi:hypothetical protein
MEEKEEALRLQRGCGVSPLGEWEEKEVPKLAVLSFLRLSFRSAFALRRDATATVAERLFHPRTLRP